MNSYTPIRATSDGMFRFNQPIRRLLVLRAYFDDSGTHGDSSAVVWAGFMGTDTEWTEFEKDWAVLLTREGLDTFHMWDLSHVDGQCQSIEWTQGRRDFVIREFREVLARRNIVGIGAVVRLDDWNEVVQKGSWLEQRLGSPNYFAFEKAIQIALGLAQSAAAVSGLAEKVSFFFDMREQEAVKNWDIAKQYSEEARWAPWYQGIAFVSMKDTLPLQAADMLAYETYQLEVDRSEQGSSAALRAHMQALLRAVPAHGTYHDAQALRILVRDIYEHERPDLLAEFDASQGQRS